jgi:hypothetical protein
MEQNFTGWEAHYLRAITKYYSWRTSCSIFRRNTVPQQYRVQMYQQSDDGERLISLLQVAAWVL